MRDDDRTPEVEEEESCTCGCGHHHHPEKEHRHEEHHHHEHDDDDCDCGHHHHDDDDDDDCGCGHHHHHDHGSEPSAEHKHIEGAVTQVFLVNNLGCAHCASKMEAKISRMPEVASCTLTYATKQLRVEAAHPLELLPRIQQICASIESEVTVSPRAARGETKREALVYGDVTGDGRVNIADLALMRRDIVENGSLLTGLRFQAGNVSARTRTDDDGKINIVDVAVMRRYIVGEQDIPQ